MSQILHALFTYEAKHGDFPLACTEDLETHQKVSWRVEILPYLDRSDLYKQYDRTQPWNSPKNRLVTGKAIPLFRCPSSSQANNGTDYLMIVGKNTVGGEPGGKGIPLSEIRDEEMSQTILAVEVPNTGIAWTEPRDITVDELIDRLDKGESAHPRGFCVALCDGSVWFLPADIDRETLRTLARVKKDGKRVNMDAFERF
jgi:hypothetical protein